MAKPKTIEELSKALTDLGVEEVPVSRKTAKGTIQGTSKVLDIASRPTVVKDFDGVKVPFYNSTGMGGKAGVAEGKWYPFFGISNAAGLQSLDPIDEKGTYNTPEGWFNKGNEDQINDYYGSQKLKDFAHQLDEQVGDLTDRFMSGGAETEINKALNKAYRADRDADRIGLVSAVRTGLGDPDYSAETFDAINQDMTPSDFSTARKKPRRGAESKGRSRPEQIATLREKLNEPLSMERDADGEYVDPYRRSVADIDQRRHFAETGEYVEGDNIPHTAPGNKAGQGGGKTSQRPTAESSTAPGSSSAGPQNGPPPGDQPTDNDAGPSKKPDGNEKAAAAAVSEAEEVLEPLTDAQKAKIQKQMPGLYQRALGATGPESENAQRLIDRNLKKLGMENSSAKEQAGMLNVHGQSAQAFTVDPKTGKVAMGGSLADVPSDFGGTGVHSSRDPRYDNTNNANQAGGSTSGSRTRQPPPPPRPPPPPPPPGGGGGGPPPPSGGARPPGNQAGAGAAAGGAGAGGGPPPPPPPPRNPPGAGGGPPPPGGNGRPPGTPPGGPPGGGGSPGGGPPGGGGGPGGPHWNRAPGGTASGAHAAAGGAGGAKAAGANAARKPLNIKGGIGNAYGNIRSAFSNFFKAGGGPRGPRGGFGTVAGAAAAAGRPGTRTSSIIKAWAFNSSLLEREMDLTTRGFVAGLGSIVNDLGLNRRETAYGTNGKASAYMDTFFGTTIRGGKGFAHPSMEVSSSGTRTGRVVWSTKATAQEALEGWSTHIDDAVTHSSGVMRGMARMRQFMFNLFGGKTSTVNRTIARLGGVGTLVAPGFMGFSAVSDFRDGYRHGGIAGGLVGAVKGVATGWIVNKMMATALLNPAAAIITAAALGATAYTAYKIFDVRNKGSEYLKMGRMQGMSWNKGPSMGMNSSMANTIKHRSIMGMENSRLNASRSMGNESYMQSAPKSRYANSTAIHSNSSLLSLANS